MLGLLRYRFSADCSSVNINLYTLELINQEMLLYSNLLLMLAAVIGFIMIFIGLHYHRRSFILVIGHVLFAVIGLASLLYEITREFISQYNIAAAVLLMLTLVVGAILAALRDNKQPPPMPAVTVHAIIGLTGITLLLLGSYQSF